MCAPCTGDKETVQAPSIHDMMKHNMDEKEGSTTTSKKGKIETREGELETTPDVKSEVYLRTEVHSEEGSSPREVRIVQTDNTNKALEIVEIEEKMAESSEFSSGTDDVSEGRKIQQLESQLEIMKKNESEVELKGKELDEKLQKLKMKEEDLKRKEKEMEEQKQKLEQSLFFVDLRKRKRHPLSDNSPPLMKQESRQKSLDSEVKIRKIKWLAKQELRQLNERATEKEILLLQEKKNWEKKFNSLKMQQEIEKEESEVFLQTLGIDQHSFTEDEILLPESSSLEFVESNDLNQEMLLKIQDMKNSLSMFEKNNRKIPKSVSSDYPERSYSSIDDLSTPRFGRNRELGRKRLPWANSFGSIRPDPLSPISEVKRAPTNWRRRADSPAVILYNEIAKMNSAFDSVDIDLMRTSRLARLTEGPETSPTPTTPGTSPTPKTPGTLDELEGTHLRQDSETSI